MSLWVYVECDSFFGLLLELEGMRSRNFEVLYSWRIELSCL